MSNTYVAPKPSYPRSAWAKAFAFRLFFPPIVVWDALKWAGNRLLGGFVGSIILPGGDIPFTALNVDPSLTTQKANDAGCSFQDTVVNTYDGAQLETVEFSSKAAKDVAFRKYILKFMGNADNCRFHCEEMLEEARDLAATVVGFNYRGVGYNSGRAKKSEHLVIDGIAQVQRLLDGGASAGNITLDGQSLGGGVASLVAAHFNALGIQLNVFNDRSFSSLHGVVSAHAASSQSTTDNKGNSTSIAANNNPSWGRRLLGFVVGSIVRFLLSLTKWRMSAGDAFSSLPITHREHLVVRTAKDARTSKVLDDLVIPHSASIHRSLYKERRTLKKDANPAAKQHLKACKVHVNPNEDEQNGHNYPRTQLFNSTSSSGESFFRQFVNDAYAHHGTKHEPPAASM